jgi:hypothetical protein
MLRNTAVDFNIFVYLLFTNPTTRMCKFHSFLRLRLCLGCYYLRQQEFGNTVTDAGRSSAERHVAPLWPRCLGRGDDPAGQDPATWAILLRTQSAVPTRIASLRPYWPWRTFTAHKSTLMGSGALSSGHRSVGSSGKCKSKRFHLYNVKACRGSVQE